MQDTISVHSKNYQWDILYISYSISQYRLATWLVTAMLLSSNLDQKLGQSHWVLCFVNGRRGKKQTKTSFSYIACLDSYRNYPA